MNEYYVYVAKINGVVSYVGSGKGDRYLHCTSGKSHNVELNKAFLSGQCITVEIVEKSLSKKTSLDKELALIKEYSKKQGLLNKQHVKAVSSKVCYTTDQYKEKVEHLQMMLKIQEDHMEAMREKFSEYTTELKAYHEDSLKLLKRENTAMFKIIQAIGSE